MIDILLATYNGEKYLKEQIDSLLNQSYTDWKLLIRDDLSNDNTLSIISEYIKKYPNKIKRYESEKRLRPCQSFNYLLQQSKSEYIMFCDQDDIWLPNKIELSLKKIKELEEKKNKGIPILVHTDLKVIDSNNKIIAESFWQLLGLNPEQKSIKDLLGTNFVTGNTVIINRKLKDKIGNIPLNANMHDWWLALVATEFGIVSYLNKTTILYRQHDLNSVGAKGVLQRSFKTHIYLINIIKQVKAFEKKYSLKFSTLEILIRKIKNYYTNLKL